MPKIRLIVGLGNPGSKYEGTRHNAGAFFVRKLARLHSVALSADRNAHGESGRGFIGDKELRFLIPHTFMNESGKSVSAMCRYYRIEHDEMLMAHDELDIHPGQARFKFDGGHGGHNGLRSVISSLGIRRDFWRLRIGIGHPGTNREVSSWVLSKANSKDASCILSTVDSAISALPILLNGQTAKAMTSLHSINHSQQISNKE